MEVSKRENVFKNLNFRLVFFGALVSELGAVLYNFAVSFYILEISDNNAFLQGLYLAVCGITLLVVTPLGGVIGDRYNKAKIMFICDYLKGALIIITSVLMMFWSDAGAHIVLLFVLGTVGNIVSGIFNPASGALLPDIVEEEKFQQANSYFSVKNSLLGIFGIILAGALYSAMQFNILFFVVGLCYIASGISEMFIKYEHTPPTDEKFGIKVALGDMKEGFVYLRSQKPVFIMVAAILFINFFFSPISSNFVPYFVKTDVASAPSYLFSGFLTPELWTSVFSTLMGLSSLIGSIVLSTRRQPEKIGRRVGFWLCLMAVQFVIDTAGYYIFVNRGVSLDAFLILFSVRCFFLGIILTNVNIPINTYLMRAVEKNKLSKVTSIISVITQGFIPLASVLAGSVLQYLGSTVLLLICALGFVATSVFMITNREIMKI